MNGDARTAEGGAACAFTPRGWWCREDRARTGAPIEVVLAEAWRNLLVLRAGGGPSNEGSPPVRPRCADGWRCAPATDGNAAYRHTASAPRGCPSTGPALHLAGPEPTEDVADWQTTCGLPRGSLPVTYDLPTFLRVKRGDVIFNHEGTETTEVCRACDRDRAVQLFHGAAPEALLVALELLEALRDEYTSGDVSGEWDCPMCLQPLDKHDPECLIGRAGPVLAEVEGKPKGERAMSKATVLRVLGKLVRAGLITKVRARAVKGNRVTFYTIRVTAPEAPPRRTPEGEA